MNPLSSLCETLRVPVLLVVTLRGDPEGPADEPQHARMGRITTDLLDLLGIEWEWFPREDAAIGPCLERAVAKMASTGLPCALVMKKGSVAPRPPAPPLEQHRPVAGSLPADQLPRATRRDWLRAVRGGGDVAGSRDRLDRLPRSRNLDAGGSRESAMRILSEGYGCASSVGLGVALAQPARRVVVLEGDGRWADAARGLKSATSASCAQPPEPPAICSSTTVATTHQQYVT